MSVSGPGDSPLGGALGEYATARFSAILRIDGKPGGTIRLADGGISGCETPGAPGLEVILLRSGRVSESDWDEAFTAAATSGRTMSAELTGRGLLGTGELEALLRTTLADAMFAIVSGVVDGWHIEEREDDSMLPLSPPAKPGWLLAEATRRTQVLAALTDPAVTAWDRVSPGPGVVRPGLISGDGRDKIVALANGRRTARDLAFVLGRGLYATMLQLARMRADNLVVTGSLDGEPGPVNGDSDGSPATLPRRDKDRSAVRTLRPRSAARTKRGGRDEAQGEGRT